MFNATVLRQPRRRAMIVPVMTKRIVVHEILDMPARTVQTAIEHPETFTRRRTIAPQPVGQLADIRLFAS
jgi:hypothetical protein